MEHEDFTIVFKKLEEARGDAAGRDDLLTQEEIDELDAISELREYVNQLVEPEVTYNTTT